MLNKSQQNQVFTVVFREEPEGGFTVYAPELPGCISYGKTLKKAQAMIREAIEGYLETLEAQGKKSFSNKSSFIGTIDISKKQYA
jgi:antitoxin HicB